MVFRPTRPRAGRALMRQAARRDMQPAVSVSCLNAALHGDIDMERESRSESCTQAGGPCSFLSADQISRRASTRPHTEEDRDESTKAASLDRHQDPSIASLVSLIDGQSGGRPGGRQWMNASSRVTSSRVRVYKPKVSHLFAFFAFAPLRIESVIRDVAWRRSSFPWDECTATHRHCVYHPHACCHAAQQRPGILFRCGVACTGL